MGSDEPNTIDSFESWLLHRVAQAVEAGEVSADLLAELRAEMERARELLQEEGRALAVQDIAERLGLPTGQTKKMLATLEAQSRARGDLLLRHIVEERLRNQGRPGMPAGE